MAKVCIDLADLSEGDRKQISEEMQSINPKDLDFDQLMNRTRQYVLEKGIMPEDYFHKYDHLRSGSTSASNFQEALKEMVQDHLTDDQILHIQTHYSDPENPGTCVWSTFLHDVEPETTSKPKTNGYTSDSEKKLELARALQTTPDKKDFTELLKQSTCFQEFDKVDSNGHVSRSQAKECFSLIGLDPEDEQMKVVMDLYTDEMGFSYRQFLQDLPASNRKPSKRNKSSIKHSKVSPQPSTNENQVHMNGGAPLVLEVHEDLADLHPEQIQINPDTNLHFRRPRNRFTISYEALVWTIFIVVTLLCVVDHFVLNGDLVLGRSGKLPKRLWGTNIGETITNVVWAITARIIITSQNLMFFTTLWCVPNLITELAPRWVTMEGIRDVHLRMHTFAGIFLIAIPSLAHVLVIFLPPILDGTALKYYPPSTFNYSTSADHLNWTQFWDPAAVQKWTFNDHTGIHLTSDELYRLFLMIALFCILFPLSRSQFLNERSYSTAMAIHAFAGVWYAVDNIRKITHGLAHVFNLPMLFIWCVDRVLSIWFYRRHHGHIIRKDIVGKNEYIVMYMKLGDKVKPGVGDVYYLLHKFKGNSKTLPQRSHPFTSFANLSQDKSWDIGFVISIMEDDKQLCKPWTRWVVSKDPSQTFTTWGPYRSSVWNLCNELRSDTSDERQPPPHYILFGTGSGFGYLLDVLSLLAYKPETVPQQQGKKGRISKVDIFFSVRCKAFYYFFRKRVDNLLKIIQEKNSALINFKFYVTCSDEESIDADDQMQNSRIQLMKGRIDFEQALKHANKNSRCFFVGRPTIAQKVEKMCNEKGIKFFKDFTNGRGGTRDRHLLMKYLKISLIVVLCSVIICVVAGMYIDVKQIKNYTYKQAANMTN